ncbi:MAG: hypothetical protein LBI04_04605 [Treponema sp.]|nr:hypothetical protein [Treponema sp.]
MLVLKSAVSVPFRSVPFRSVPFRSVPFRSVFGSEDISCPNNSVNSEQGTVNSDQLTGNSVLVRGHSVLPSRPAFKQKHCSLFTVNCSLHTCSLLFSLLFLLLTVNLHAQKNLILTEDIVLENWSPTNLAAGRNFYGNGHTVTIRSFASTVTSGNIGFFAVVGDGALIRDVTIVYEDLTAADKAVKVTTSGAAQFGGIAGTTQGKSQLINVQVKGAVTMSGSGSTITGNAYAGGIVGRMEGTSGISSAYSSLDLTVNTSVTGNLNVGGIAGYIYGTSAEAVKVKDVSVVGDIAVGKTGAVDANILYVGGLVGYFYRGLLDNSVYREGNISISSGGGISYMGGGTGVVSTATITGCSSLAGNFDISKTVTGSPSFYAGGFLGLLSSGAVKDCYSNNSVVVNASPGYSGIVIGGGFVGGTVAASTIIHCYALGDVSLSGYGGIYAGGFAGNTAARASYCYATGNVNGYIKGTSGQFHSGGFVGYGMLMNDCYAIGDVFVDASSSSIGSTSPINAGALSGISSSSSIDNPPVVVQRCFAKGSVTVQRNSNTGVVCAGGLAGIVNSSIATFKDCAALGPSITVTGGATRNIGRVYGSKHASTTVQTNHANNGMRLYESGIYGAGTPGVRPLFPLPSDDNEHGQDAHSGNFRDPSFWQTTLDFTAAHWDFNNVGLKGYPRLKASNGTIMGGQ